jgi:hypothetical protein
VREKQTSCGHPKTPGRHQLLLCAAAQMLGKNNVQFVFNVRAPTARHAAHTRVARLAGVRADDAA